MNKEAKKIMSWKDRTWLDEHDDGYEEFYKKGGTYVIPVERFNEFIKQKEVIDKLNDLLSDEFLEVIDRDILKEVSE